jgi:hypothetical protein
MSYIILRRSWCYIIAVNVHDPTEDKIDDMKGSFYDELADVFDKLPKYHMSLLLSICTTWKCMVYSTKSWLHTCTGFLIITQSADG